MIEVQHGLGVCAFPPSSTARSDHLVFRMWMTFGHVLDQLLRWSLKNLRLHWKDLTAVFIYRFLPYYFLSLIQYKIRGHCVPLVYLRKVPVLYVAPLPLLASSSKDTTAWLLLMIIVRYLLLKCIGLYQLLKGDI